MRLSPFGRTVLEERFSRYYYPSRAWRTGTSTNMSNQSQSQSHPLPTSVYGKHLCILRFSLLLFVILFAFLFLIFSLKKQKQKTALCCNRYLMWRSTDLETNDFQGLLFIFHLCVTTIKQEITSMLEKYYYYH